MGRCKILQRPIFCIMDKSLQALKDEMRSAIEDLGAAETQLRPRLRPAAWSIQQIVEHLLLTYAWTAEVFQSRLVRGSATKKQPTALQRIMQTVIVTCGYFPPGRSAPEPVQPKPITEPLSGPGLSSLVVAKLSRLEDLSRQAEEEFGSGRSVTHFLLGPMSIRQWRRFHLVHARHHLKQIAAIRRDYKIGAASVRHVFLRPRKH